MQIFKKIRLFILATLVAVVLPQVGAFAEDAQYHFQRGHQFYLESKSSQSETEFKKALQLDPDLSLAHYYLSSIYFKLERYAEAISQCEEALRINPKELNCLIILGLSFQQSGLNDQAISTLQMACNIDGQSVPAHSALGLAYCAKGELAKAKKEYSILKKLDSELADDLLQRINAIEK